jgi:hypothetical protein
MIRRLLSAAALVAALTVSSRAVAKPPDLPMNPTITVKPQVAPEIEGPPDPRENQPPSGGTIVPEPQPPQPQVIWSSNIIEIRTLETLLSLPIPCMVRFVPAEEKTIPVTDDELPLAHPLLDPTLTLIQETTPFSVHPNREHLCALTGQIVMSQRKKKTDEPDAVQILVEEELQPIPSLYATLPTELPTPSLYQLTPTARQTLAGSFLFGFNPLLALLPTDKFLDSPHDHPQSVAGDDVLSDLPSPLENEYDNNFFFPGRSGEHSWHFGESYGDSWLKWLVSHWAAHHGVPTPEQQEGRINEHERFISGLTPAGESDAYPVPEDEPLPMPRECAPSTTSEDGVTCPWLRQQATDRHAVQFADPDVSRDVLANLEKLRQADDLIELAEELAAAGDIDEALECCALVEDLCPGSPCAHRAVDVMFDLCFGINQPASGGEEAAEEHSEADAASPPVDGVEMQVNGLMKACRLLMNEGMHCQAAELARQAYALDPERVMADPLVYKMHLLTHSREHQPAGASEASEPPLCPYCPPAGKPIPGVVPQKKKTKSGSSTLLVPPLPDIEYEVVPVHERVLAENTEKLHSPAGKEEASEEDAPSSLTELVETMMGCPGQFTFGVGFNEDGGLRWCGEITQGSEVYHLLFTKGCLAIWKTPNAAKSHP